jgi:hypothetical protein
MGDATRHEQLIERQLVKESKWRYRRWLAQPLRASAVVPDHLEPST